MFRQRFFSEVDMLEQEFDPSNAETLAQFRKIPVFSSLTETMLLNVVGMSRMRKYEKGEFLIHEGDYDAWIFFLVKGELRITHKGVEVGGLRRLGDVFGEMGIIDGSPRSASIQALSTTICVAVDASILERPAEQETYMVQAILYRIFCEVLATRLREMDKKIYELTHKKG